jgi:hypothetical protein
MPLNRFSTPYVPINIYKLLIMFVTNVQDHSISYKSKQLLVLVFINLIFASFVIVN